ncbi:MAG TPA: hypothetical protein PLP03_09260, partial [Bacteroidales bacterium]|nr:hypothetical protein [Bacteroidales bacterium]
ALMMPLKKIDFSNRKNLEKYSSAFTLSDMEVFIFPELFYPLVIANIMSPLIWKWRDDPWFRDIEKKSFIYKANRIKQYIIQNYVFNLDLATWGLTTKSRELERFRDFFDPELLKQSNALFGYEGDKYYFDIDIRKHFGLDKYDSDIIPYWKTETVEAMTAFRHKDNFTTGAGECVSFSALYAAAMFIVGRIELEKIFLIATPLHSQNYINEKEGLITNNRRIVTKNMWYNGTSLSEKARRALENERVTIVSHITGYIHTLYREATININAYNSFASKLKEFLATELSDVIFINFLRFKSKYKNLFQYCCDYSGVCRFIALEKMFEYEHTSKFNVSPESRKQLINEIEGDEFHLSPLHGRIILNDIEKAFNESRCKNPEDLEQELMQHKDAVDSKQIADLIKDLSCFVFTEPKLPDTDKSYVGNNVPEIAVTDDRKTIMKKVREAVSTSETALLSLYVYRQMDEINWLPFIKATIERNPVCFTDLEGKTTEEVYEMLNSMPNESIYEENRLALPDEVWNFQRGDGIEKALLLVDFMILGDYDPVLIEIDHERVDVRSGHEKYHFTSGKNLKKSIEISGHNINIEQG